jgi:hypothetical protein
MKAITLLSTALFLLAPASALADDPPRGTDDQAIERPGTGIGELVTGSVFLGLGAVNLATSPICLALPDQSTQKPCLIASLAIGGTFFVVGVPLVAVGAVKRRTFKAWRAEHPGVGGVGFSPTKGGGALTWTAQF